MVSPQQAATLPGVITAAAGSSQALAGCNAAPKCTLIISSWVMRNTEAFSSSMVASTAFTL